MPIERFIWTTHAEDRLDDRHLTFEAVYDHPAQGQPATARVVSVWRVD